MCSAILARHLASALEAAPGTAAHPPSHPALPAPPHKLAPLKLPARDAADQPDTPTGVVDSRAFESPDAYSGGGAFADSRTYSERSDDSASELPDWGFVVQTSGELSPHRYPGAIQSAA